MREQNMNLITTIMKVRSIKNKLALIKLAWKSSNNHRQLLKSHLKTTQTASMIALVLYAKRQMTHPTMVSLSRNAETSIAAIKSLIYRVLIAEQIEVTYNPGELKTIIPRLIHCKFDSNTYSQKYRDLKITTKPQERFGKFPFNLWGS
jgi:hypothetical protein